MFCCNQLVKQKLKKFSDIPDEVLVKEQEIKNQITYWELNKSSIKNSDIELARLYKKMKILYWNWNVYIQNILS